MCKSKILSKNIFGEESEARDLTEEKYNQDYEASISSSKEGTYQSRLAKKTPTKSGYFMTCWAKDEDNYSQPYKIEELADYLIVAVIDDKLNDYFLFPRELLVKKGILAPSKYQGRMALRVYSKWCNQLNKTAGQTQK